MSPSWNRDEEGKKWMVALLKVSRSLETEIVQQCPNCKESNYTICDDGIYECNHCGRLFLPTTAGVVPALRAIRLRRKIEAQLIAREVGVSRQAIWKWETGKTNPTKKNARKIVQVYSKICGCDT